MSVEDLCPYEVLEDPRRAAWLEGFRARGTAPILTVHPESVDRWVELEDEDVPELRGVPVLSMGIHREMRPNENAVRELVVSAADGTHISFEVVGPPRAFSLPPLP